MMTFWVHKKVVSGLFRDVVDMVNWIPLFWMDWDGWMVLYI